MGTRPDIPALTGLRGVAALFVVINHYAPGAAPFALATAPAWLRTLLATSDYGMTLFFTLSGFVIAYNYLDLPWQTATLRSLATFGWARFSRLYPLLFLFMLVHIDWSSLDAWTAMHFAGVETWITIKHGGALPAAGRFHVSWSISTEFGLYVCFAAVMVLAATLPMIGRRVLMVICGGYLAAAILVVMSASLQEAIMARLPMLMETFDEQERWHWLMYLGPYYRIVEFALGAGAAWMVTRRSQWLKRGHLGAVAIVCIVLLVGLQAQHNFGTPIPITRSEQQLLSSLLFATIMLGCHLEHPVARILALSPLIFVGEVSYSLYLFHFSAASLASLYGSTAAYDPSMLPLFVCRFVLGLLFALALAAGLYRLVELPCKTVLRRLASRIASRATTAPMSHAALVEQLSSTS